MKRAAKGKPAVALPATTTQIGSLEPASASPTDDGFLSAWVLAGFLLVYIPFLFVPVFFNQEQIMDEICPVYRIKTVGMDLKELHHFSGAWAKGGTPYILTNSYPPLETLFFVPLLPLNIHTAYVLITVISLGCYLFITLVLPVLFSRGRRPSSPIILFLATGLFSHGLLFELERGQFNLIAMSFCLLGVYLFHFHPRWRLGAYGLFSLSAQLKIYPALFILMLVDNWRDWKAILKRFALIGAANFLCLFALGLGPFQEFVIRTWAKMSKPDLWPGNHSIFCYSAYLESLLHIPARLLSPGLLSLTLLMLSAIVLLSFTRRVTGFNPYLLVACTIGALIIPALSHDYTLSFLTGTMATFLSLVRLDQSAPPAKRFLQKAAILAISGAYFSTVFSVFLKTNVVAPPLAMATPMLLVILAATTVLFVIGSPRPAR